MLISIFFLSLSFVGGHINPAVTLALAVCGRFKWSKLPVYWISQLIGAILGSGIVFAAYQGRHVFS